MLNKIVLENTDSIIIQLFRYLFVGLIAFGVDFSALYIFTDYFGIYYLISAALAFLFGVTVNYLISIFWVFNKRKLKLSSEFSVFFIIGLVGLLFTELIIWFFTEKLALYYMLSKFLSVFIVFLWNFAARKFILFN